MSADTFPIQARHGTPDPRTVSRADAEVAYRAYSAMFGTQQSLDRLGERGGFGYIEFLALTDTARWMDSQQTYNAIEQRNVFHTALEAQALMHPDGRTLRERKHGGKAP